MLDTLLASPRGPYFGKATRYLTLLDTQAMLKLDPTFLSQMQPFQESHPFLSHPKHLAMNINTYVNMPT